MAREVTEVHTFSKEQIEGFAMFYAKYEIIGSFYVGVMKEQTVQWKDDGSLIVTTKHMPE